MIKYELTVKGIMVDGHPILILNDSLEIISKTFDDLVKRYPYNEVQLFAYTKRLIKISTTTQKPFALCPWKHTGMDRVTNLPVVRLGSNGLFFCSVCGWKEEQESNLP